MMQGATTATLPFRPTGQTRSQSTFEFRLGPPIFHTYKNLVAASNEVFFIADTAKIVVLARYRTEYSRRSNTLPSSPLISTIIFAGFFVTVSRM